jgi:hypothetical protein
VYPGIGSTFPGGTVDVAAHFISDVTERGSVLLHKHHLIMDFFTERNVSVDVLEAGLGRQCSTHHPTHLDC